MRGQCADGPRAPFGRAQSVRGQCAHHLVLGGVLGDELADGQIGRADAILDPGGVAEDRARGLDLPRPSRSSGSMKSVKSGHAMPLAASCSARDPPCGTFRDTAPVSGAPEARGKEVIPHTNDSIASNPHDDTETISHCIVYLMIAQCTRYAWRCLVGGGGRAVWRADRTVSDSKRRQSLQALDPICPSCLRQTPTTLFRQ